MFKDLICKISEEKLYTGQEQGKFLGVHGKFFGVQEKFLGVHGKFLGVQPG